MKTLFMDDAEPRFHGNGFIQLYLDERTRLHIWTPELPPIKGHNATIHTHRYDMVSNVLEGMLKHTTYDVTPAIPGLGRGMATCKVVQLTGDNDHSKKPGQIMLTHYRHTVRHEYWLPAGARYTFKEGLFHDTENGHDGVTVTIFRKISEDADDLAKILVTGTDEKPTDAFDPKTQPSQAEMWKHICRVVTKHGRRIAEIISA